MQNNVGTGKQNWKKENETGSWIITSQPSLN